MFQKSGVPSRKRSDRPKVLRSTENDSGPSIFNCESSDSVRGRRLVVASGRDHDHDHAMTMSPPPALTTESTAASYGAQKALRNNSIYHQDSCGNESCY